MNLLVGSRLKYCDERSRLFGLMRVAANDYGRRAAQLSKCMGFMNEAEYKKARDEVVQARLDAEQAREALHLHQSEHGC